MKYLALIFIIPIISLFTFFDSETGLTTDEDVKVGLSVGDKAPELSFTSHKGEELSLYSLKGKMVLIDFWAAWCRPCRMENPHVVKAYNEFKDKQFKDGDGFTVFGVSLDQNKNSWIDAIKKDGLLWEYHISDLKGWQSELSATYKVKSIPANYLIDGNGIIIAINLRGNMLHSTLEALVKKNEFAEVANRINEICSKLEKMRVSEDYTEYSKEVIKLESKLKKINESFETLKEQYKINTKTQE